MTFVLKETDGFVDLFCFLLPQRDVLKFSPIATASKVEASETYVVRELCEMRVAFIPAGRVAVKIEDDVFGVMRQVQR